MGQSPRETRHAFPVVLFQGSHMGTLLLATMCRKTYKVLPTTDAPLSFGEQSFIGVSHAGTQARRMYMTDLSDSVFSLSRGQTEAACPNAS